MELEIDLCNKAKMTAKFTLPFEIETGALVDMPAKKGQFIIFTERCMQGSQVNTSARSRMGVNCRVISSDTLVYPGRLKGHFIDGSNLNIRKHRAVLLSGVSRNPDNLVQTVNVLY